MPHSVEVTTPPPAEPSHKPAPLRASRRKRRWTSVATSAVVAVIAGGAVLAGTLEASAAQGPASPPSGVEARQMWNDQRLAGYVEPEVDYAGYSRSLFPHWRIVGPPGGATGGPNCAADKWVKIRDRTAGTVSGCDVVNGQWLSVFDGVTTTDPSTFDADHIVPLHEAWKSGASDWTTDQRAVFANDVDVNLVAVSRSSNTAKGDQDPGQWMPPNGAIHCTYLEWWVEVKVKYGLTIDQTEWDSVNTNLGSC